MIATILTIIAYLLPLIMEAVKEQRNKSKGIDHEANIQEFRKILSRDAKSCVSTSNALDAALADQHDRVQSAVRGS